MASITNFLSVIWDGLFSIKIPFLNYISFGTLAISVFAICLLLKLLHFVLSSAHFSGSRKGGKD